ncbi:MAG TPA: hypothetical protein VG273_10420 [Bryobacteraceae bacterium]|nr:hypothetical protein [Bryobacteraceae bacterium]
MPSRIKIALFALALLCCSCDELNPKRPKPVVVVWKEIGMWSGRGSLQTGTFDLGIAEWRVRWKTSNQTPGKTGKFVLTANSAVSGRPIAEVANHVGPGEGTGYVNDDPRQYYLVIDSKDVDWTITAEVSIVTGGR